MLRQPRMARQDLRCQGEVFELQTLTAIERKRQVRCRMN